MGKKLYSGGGLKTEITRFGTLSKSLSNSNAYLRMIGLNNGLKLNTCSDIDAASAIIGADTWMMLIGGNGIELNKPVSSDTSAIKVLANIILRSCGQPNDNLQSVYYQGIASNELTLSIMEEQVNQEAWLRKILGADGDLLHQVFSKVSADFATANELSTLAYYNELLISKYLE